jgi:sugar-specific transcriptional regulator TrmB
LEGLGIKGTAQTVLIYLIENGVSTVATIAAGIRTPKSSIYSALEELTSAGFIIEYSENRSKEYGVIDEQQFKDLVEKRIQDMKSHQETLMDYMKASHSSKKTIKPKIKFYLGVEGIRQSFRDMPWRKDCREAYIMWSTKDMVDAITPEFSEWHASKRLKYKVMLYAIRKYSDRVMNDEPQNKKLLQSEAWTAQREVRYAPKNTEWTMSYWIYGDKCLFSNSVGEKFAFIIHSQEFADLMKVLWQNVWKVSKLDFRSEI